MNVSQLHINFDETLVTHAGRLQLLSHTCLRIKTQSVSHLLLISLKVSLPTLLLTSLVESSNGNRNTHTYKHTCLHIEIFWKKLDKPVVPLLQGGAGDSQQRSGLLQPVTAETGETIQKEPHTAFQGGLHVEKQEPRLA